MEKVRHEVLPSIPQIGMHSSKHLDFSPVHPLPDFWHITLENNKYREFLATKFSVFCNYKKIHNTDILHYRAG
jgi:hypothetical protein